MTREFTERVLSERVVDTKTYRYAAKECGDDEKQWLEIRRIRLEKLGTTAALDDWETVKVIA